MGEAMAQVSKNALEVPTKPLPVTLLSGFLGSGKTTLLQHILRSHHGLRIAVIVNDIGAINVDANLIKGHYMTKTEEKVIALQNGCICCTLRGDLLQELVRLAEVAEFDYVIIESSGISEPEQVAETFDVRLVEQVSSVGGVAEGLDESTVEVLKRLMAAGGLEKFAKLDTVCTVVDIVSMFQDFETSDLLSARRDDVVAEDERTISDLLVDQIEFADVLILNKVDKASKEILERARALVKRLNHRAEVLECKYGRIDPTKIVNTGIFNLELAQTGYGWLQDLHAMTLREVNGRMMATPKPETEEYNVRNFVYVRRRPFHPRRLFAFLYDRFILQSPQDEEEEDGEEGVKMEDAGSSEDGDVDGDSADGMEMDDDPLEIPDNEEIIANKQADPLLARLFRSKGEYWLATRPGRAGEWSQAGVMLTLQGGRRWFCTVARSEYETGVPEIDAMVASDLEKGGVWGDRRQELVFIGEDLNVKGLEARLDQCLLTDSEWEQWQGIMKAGVDDMVDGEDGEALTVEDKLADLFDDGFPGWTDAENHTHDGHDHGGHDHAGHKHADHSR